MILPAITMPWPDTPLWPNSRKHRQVVAAHRKQQRALAYGLALEHGMHRLNVPEGVIKVSLFFCPPSLRSFDTDNAVSAMKGAIDGLADALHINDRWFQPVPYRGEKCRDGGVLIYAEATGETWMGIGAVALSLVNEKARQRGNAPGNDRQQSKGNGDAQ